MILKDKIVHVLGAGRSGRAAAVLAHSRGANVTLFDSCEHIDDVPQGIATSPRATVEVGRRSSCDILVISPGIATYGDLVEAFSENAGEMIGETELGYCFYDGKVIGITGTNGKTTTTELVQRIISHSGTSCLCCGNHGQPLSEVVMLEDVPRVIALELSSFQLETIKTFHADVAIWLNFDADHMDRYSCLTDYKKAKLRIFENQTEEDVAIVRHSEDLGELKAQTLTFSTEHKYADMSYVDGAILYQEKHVLDVEHTLLRGLHNIENTMAAIAACIKVGINPERIEPSLKTFSPPLHP